MSLGQINGPSSGKCFSLPFLPAISSTPSWTLEGLFEMTQLPSRALDSPRALLPDLQRETRTPSGGPRTGTLTLSADTNLELCVGEKRTFLH